MFVGEDIAMTNSSPGVPTFDVASVTGALAEVFGSIVELAATFDEADWDRPTRCPGWTVKDAVSHMIGTESMLAGHPQPEPVTSDAEHLRNDIGRFNEAAVLERRDIPGADVLAEFEVITAERLAALGAMSQAAFDEEAWTPAGHATYGRFMQIRIFDCWMHEQDIRAAVGRQGHLSGPGVEYSLDEISTAIGFVVGKRAGAPKGSSVALVITGPTRRRFDIEVQDRAQLSSTPTLNPTATLSTDLETFVALAGGRVDAEDPAIVAKVELAGDAELGLRLRRNLTFVI